MNGRHWVSTKLLLSDLPLCQLPLSPGGCRNSGKKKETHMHSGSLLSCWKAMLPPLWQHEEAGWGAVAALQVLLMHVFEVAIVTSPDLVAEYPPAGILRHVPRIPDFLTASLSPPLAADMPPEPCRGILSTPPTTPAPSGVPIISGRWKCTACCGCRSHWMSSSPTTGHRQGVNFAGQLTQRPHAQHLPLFVPKSREVLLGVAG